MMLSIWKVALLDSLFYTVGEALAWLLSPALRP